MKSVVFSFPFALSLKVTYPLLMVVRDMNFSLFPIMYLEYPLLMNQKLLDCLMHNYKKNNHFIDNGIKVVFGPIELVNTMDKF